MSDLPVFQRLSPSVQLYTPPNTSPTTVVLLCAWMDAPARAIAKYTHEYVRLFPSGCSILLLTCTCADFTVRPLAVQRRRLAPALAFVLGLSARDTLATPAPTDAKLHVHIFSNGGAHQFLLLARLYRDHASNPAALPMPVYTAMVLDSCPGSPEAWTAARGLASTFGRGAQAWWYRWLMVTGIYATAAVTGLLWLVLGRENQIARLWRALNDHSLVSPHVARTYLYSTADRVVDYEDVEFHAVLARGEGYAVTFERFDGTPHVAHVRGDPARYWDIVSRSFVGESGDAFGRRPRYPY